MGSVVDAGIGGVRCCGATAPPSDVTVFAEGGDIDSTRVFADFGEGDWATRVICLSSVVLLDVELPVPPPADEF